MPAVTSAHEAPWRGVQSIYRSVIVRDGDEVEIGNRNERPITRYFPEVGEAVGANFPARAVIDGEIVVALYAGRGVLVLVGVIGAFPMATRMKLFDELQPWVTTFDGHPWHWAAHEAGERTPRKNETSRWNVGKDLSFVPVRPERVVQVRYGDIEGERFRLTAQFVRWRPDREPASCTYDQLDRPVRFNLADVLISGEGPA